MSTPPEYPPQTPDYGPPQTPLYGPAEPPAYGPPQPFPYGAPQSPQPVAAPGTNGLAIAGLVLAFLIAPIGLILSIFGLISASRRGQKGKGLAIAGIIISIVITGAVTAGAYAVYKALPTNITTIADPGCLMGRAAILNSDTLSEDPAALTAQLKAVSTQLAEAEKAAKNSKVRDALKAMGADYNELAAAIEAQSDVSPALQAKLTDDGNAFDSLCTIGAAQ